MTTLRHVRAAEAPLELWQPEGVTVLQGDPAGRGFTLVEQDSTPVFGTGVFASEPAQTTYELTSNEIIYVLEGSVTITLDDGQSADLSVGDLAFLPKGHVSTWTFHTAFKEVWFLVG